MNANINTSISLKDHGDDLEHTYYEFIHNKLSNYEKIWQIYVGNDNKNLIPVIQHLKVSDTKIRERISRHHYTVLESIICMNRITIKFNSLHNNSIRTLDDYLDTMNNFTSFQAHAGRVKGNLEHITGAASRTDVTTGMGRPSVDSLDKYWLTRNIALHDIKLPQDLDKELLQLKIALPKHEHNDGLGAYDVKNSSWANLTGIIWYDLPSYLQTTFDEFVDRVNDILGEVLILIETIVKAKSIIIPVPGAPQSRKLIIPATSAMPLLSGKLNMSGSNGQ